MTSLVQYGHRGRVAFAVWAWHNFASEVQEGDVIGASKAGAIGIGATIALWIPDPISTAVGWGLTRGSNWLYNQWWRMNNAYWGMSMAKRSVVTYLVILPFAIADNQFRAQEEGLIGTGEELGRAMTLAQTIPETERYRIPSIPTSRVF